METVSADNPISESRGRWKRGIGLFENQHSGADGRKPFQVIRTVRSSRKDATRGRFIKDANLGGIAEARSFVPCLWDERPFLSLKCNKTLKGDKLC